MVKYGGFFCAVILCCLMFACSSVRRLRPLESGTSAVTVSLGGPITEVAKKNIPLPLLSLGYNYGINDKFGVEAAANVTCALFGLLHFEAGVNWFPLKSDGFIPGIVVTPKFFLMSNFEGGGTRFYPTLMPTFYWDIGRHLVYIGAENWFVLNEVRSDGNEQPHHWLVAPCLGYGITWKKWQFQLEGKAYTPNLKNTGRATKNIGFADYGIIGVFLGFSRAFGGRS